MSSPPDDATQTNRVNFLWMKRVGYIILNELAGAPTGHVKRAVVQREINVGNEWRHGAKALQEGRKIRSLGGLCRDIDDFLDAPLGAGAVAIFIAVPDPDRGGKVLERGHNSQKAVGPSGIVSRAQLESHLILITEKEFLQVTPSSEIPYLYLVAIFPAKKKLRIDTVLDHVGSAPRAADHNVKPEVPPDVISQLLGATIKFPLSANLKRLWVQDEGTSRTVPVRGAQGTYVNSFWTAMDRVRGGIAGARGQLLRSDDLHYGRLSRVRFGVQNVDARRVDTRDDEIAALHMRVRCVGTEARTAGVPTEVVEFVANDWHVHLPDQAAVALRIR